MSASIMLGRDLDVLPPYVAVRVFVLDANIREMNLIVEVRQVVLASPFLNLFDSPIRPAVAVAVAAIAFLKETLVLAFQFTIKLNAQNSRIAVLQPLGSLQLRAIELRVVGSLARLVGARIEGLATIRIGVAMVVQERAAALGEDDCAVLTVKRNALDEALIFQVASIERIVA